MHNIGVLQRRGLKKQLVQHPPIPGELVYAVDTDEYGVLIDGILVWRKFFSSTGGVSGGSSDVTSVNGRTGDVVLNKSDVLLGNVDNTSDIDKPISTAVQDALNTKLDISNSYTSLEIDNLLNAKVGVGYSYSKQKSLSIFEQLANKGISNGYAELDKNGKVPISQMYNSDGIAEYSSYSDFPNVGVENFIYIDKSSNIAYRYDTTANTYQSLGSSSYIRSKPTQISVGGVTKGTTFDGSVSDALDKILFPYVEPKILSFSTNVPSQVQVGQTIPSGSYKFSWSFDLLSNISSAEILLGNTSIYTIDINNTSSSIDLSDLVLDQVGTKKFTLSIYSTNKTNITKSIYIHWLDKVYYGAGSSVITEADMSVFANLLTNTQFREYQMPADNYKWICYPVGFGSLNSTNKFMNNGFIVPMETPVIISKTDFVQTDYYCIRTTNEIIEPISILLS